MVLEYSKDKSERFQSPAAKAPSPGPGSYDPKFPQRCGFLSPRNCFGSIGSSHHGNLHPSGCISAKKLAADRPASTILTPRHFNHQLPAIDQGRDRKLVSGEPTAQSRPTHASNTPRNRDEEPTPLGASTATQEAAACVSASQEEHDSVRVKPGSEADAPVTRAALPTPSWSPVASPVKASVNQGCATKVPAKTPDQVPTASASGESSRHDVVDPDGQLAATQAQLAEVRRREAALVSEVHTKEESANVLRGQMVSQLSELAKLRFSVSNLTMELLAAKEAITQRDDHVAHLNILLEGFKRQLGEAQQLASKRHENHAHHDCTPGDAGTDVTQQSSAALPSAGEEQPQQLVIKQQLQLEERSKRISRLEQEIVALSDTLKKQAEAFTRRGKLIEELRDATSQNEAKAADLGAQLATERAAAQAHTDMVSRLSDAVAQRDHIITGLQKELAEFTTANKTPGVPGGEPASGDDGIYLRDQHQSAETDSQGLQEQCAELMCKLTAMQAENEELRASHENLARQYETLRSEAQQLEVEGARNCALILRLAEAERELEFKRQELAAEREEGSKARAHAAELITQLNSASESLTAVSSGTAARDDALTALKAEVHELHSLTAELWRARESAGELQATVARLEQQIAKRETQVAELKAQLAEQGSALQASGQRVFKLLAEAEAAAEAAADSRERIRDLEASLAHANNERAQLASAATGFEAAKADLEQLLAAQQIKTASTTAELSAARAALDDATAREAELRDKVAAAATQDNAESLKQQLEDKSRQVEELKETCDAFMQHIMNVTSRGADLHVQLQELEKQRDADMVALSGRLATAEARFEAAMAELTVVAEEAGRLQAGLTEAQSIIDRQASELATRTAAATEYENEVAFLGRELMHAKASLAGLTQELIVVKTDLEKSKARCKALESKLYKCKDATGEPATTRIPPGKAEAS